jgi:hypothetical protein
VNHHKSSKCSRGAVVTRRACGGPHPYPEPGRPHPEGRRCYCARCERAGGRWAWSLPEMTSEVGQTGLCRLGHPVTALADTTAGRLYATGIGPHDPALTALRAWNGSVLSRRATWAPGDGHGIMGATFASPQEATRPQKQSSAPRLGSASTSESDWDLVAVALAGAATGPCINQESR